MADLNMMRFVGELRSFAKDYGTRFNNVKEGIDMFRGYLLNKYGRDQLRTINNYIDRIGNTVTNYFDKKLPQTVQPAGSQKVDTNQKKLTTSKQPQKVLTTSKTVRPQLTGSQVKLIEDLKGRGATNQQIYDTLWNGSKELEGMLQKGESAILNSVKNSVKNVGANIKNMIRQGFTVPSLIKGGIIGMALDQQLKSHTATQAQEDEAMHKWYADKGLTIPTASAQKETKAQPVVTQSQTPTPSINLPPAPADSIEQFILDNTDANPPIYDYNNGGTLPPVQMGDGSIPSQEPIPTQDGAITGGASPTFTYSPYTPTVDYNMTPQEQELIQNLVNSQGQVTSQQLLQAIQDRYNNIQDVINSDPRYQGGLVQARGYYIDPKKYQQLAAMDRAGNAINQIYGLGNTSNLAGQYADEQQRIYEIQMANQAGVPYEDYKAAMLERQKQAILMRQKEVENMLTLQANQTNDMKEKLGLLQEIYKTRVQAQRDLDVANANAYGDIQKQQLTNIGNVNVANITQQGGLQKQELANRGSADVANINAQGDIMKQRELLEDPIYQLKGAGTFYSGMGYLPPAMQAGAMQNLSPSQQQTMFGTQFTPQQIQQMFGVGTPQQQNADQFTFNRFMSKIRGIQANEQ